MASSLSSCLLSILLAIIVADLRCPPSTIPYQVTCPNHPILYLFDETTSFGTDGFSSEISFFQQRVIPITDWSLPISGKLTNKGLADFYQTYPITAANDVCAALNQLETQYPVNVASSSNNLYAMIQNGMKWAKSMDEPATIVLFASTQNKTETSMAAKYVDQNKGQETFLVVAMRRADFNMFPAKKLYEVDDLDYPPYCLAYVLQQDACGDYGTCINCPCPEQPGNFSAPFTTPQSLSTTPVEITSTMETIGTASTSPMAVTSAKSTSTASTLRSTTSTSTLSPVTSTTTQPSTSQSSTIEPGLTSGTSTEATVTTTEPTALPGSSTTVESPSTIITTKGKSTTPEIITTYASSIPTGLPPTDIPMRQLNPECECDYEKVWTDAVFLFDSSAATGDMGLQEMWVSTQSWLGFFNVQRHDYNQSTQFMQIGVIVYAKETQIVSHLGEWNGDDLLEQEMLPYKGGLADDLQGAIRAAILEFSGDNRRANSQQVIVLMATDYSSTNNPQLIAAEFKEDGGILMVFNYLETHGEPLPLPELKELASEGYFFDSQQNDNVDLQQAQCDANCFCLDNYQIFQPSIRGYPTAGCYGFPTIQANFRLAEHSCEEQGGVLAVDESQEKTAFFRQKFSNQSLWINLVHNTYEWAWYGQIPVNTSSYSPWTDGQIPDGAGGNNHAVLTQDNMWMATSPSTGYYYICELPPCDSSRYCA